MGNVLRKLVELLGLQSTCAAATVSRLLHTYLVLKSIAFIRAQGRLGSSRRLSGKRSQIHREGFFQYLTVMLFAFLFRHGLSDMLL